LPSPKWHQPTAEAQPSRSMPRKIPGLTFRHTTIRGTTTIPSTATVISTVPTPPGSLLPSHQSPCGTITGICLLRSSIIRLLPMDGPSSIVRRGGMVTPAIRRVRPKTTMRSAIFPRVALTIQGGTTVRRSRRRPPGARAIRIRIIGRPRRMPPPRASRILAIDRIVMLCRRTRNARPPTTALLPPGMWRLRMCGIRIPAAAPRQIPRRGVHGTRVRLIVRRRPPGNTPSLHRPTRHLRRRLHRHLHRRPLRPARKVIPDQWTKNVDQDAPWAGAA
jgi:hypothetical protein